MRFYTVKPVGLVILLSKEISLGPASKSLVSSLEVLSFSLASRDSSTSIQATVLSPVAKD
jgi:hypothetical protein